MYTFPTLEQLADASEEDFKELKTGFRAPYIMDAIRRKLMESVLTEINLGNGFMIRVLRNLWQ